MPCAASCVHLSIPERCIGTGLLTTNNATWAQQCYLKGNGKKKRKKNKTRPHIYIYKKMRVRDVSPQMMEEKVEKCRVGGTLSLVRLHYCGIKSGYIITFSLPRSGTDGKAWWESTRNNVGVHCCCEVSRENWAPRRWAQNHHRNAKLHLQPPFPKDFHGSHVVSPSIPPRHWASPWPLTEDMLCKVNFFMLPLSIF